MPGEFNDLIPLPNRAPQRTFDEDILDADGLAGFIGGMQHAPARQPRRPVDPEVLDALGEVGFIGGIEDEPSAPAISSIPNDSAIDDPDGLGGFAASDGVPLRTGVRDDPTAVLRDRTGAIRQIGAFEAGLLNTIQGATGGFLDETVGGVIALLARASGDERPFEEIFIEKVAPVRTLIEESRRQQPTISTVSEIVGTAAGPGKVLRLAGLTTRATARLRDKALGAVIENAAIGALTGVGNADGRDLVAEGAKGALGGVVLGTVGQAAGKSVGLAIDKALGRFKNVPTLNAVNEAARTIFKSAGAAGVRVAQPAFRRFTTEATAFANRQKAFPGNAPGTARVLQSMERLSSKNPTFLELLRLRGSMRRVVERAKPGSADRRLVGTMLGRLNASMIRLSPRSVVSPDPRAARRMLPDIREFWRRSGNSQIIDDVFGQAKRRAGTNPKRKDVQIALRRSFLELAKDRARLRNFTRAEQDAIKRVAEGGPLERSLINLVNKLADPNRTSTRIVKSGGELIGAISASTVGDSLNDKGAAAAGVVAATELGSRLPEATVAAGRALERGLIRRGARKVDLMVRSGGALPPPTPAATEASALVRLGLAGQGQAVAKELERIPLP